MAKAKTMGGEDKKPKTQPAPPLPFASDESDWENDLAAWDASLPIEETAGEAGDSAPAPAPEAAPPPAAPTAPSDADGDLWDEPTTDVTTVAELEARAAAATAPAAVVEIDAFAEAADEFSERAAPSSEVYGSTVPTGGAVEGLFQREPPAEPPAVIFGDPLLEMTADPWRAGAAAMVSVPVQGAACAPDQRGWRDLAALFADEGGTAATAAHQADLRLAAARAAQMLGDAAAALRLADDALTLQPASAAALRARLLLLEAQQDGAAASETLARLCDALGGAGGDREEHDRYRALRAEWTLARTGALDARAGAGQGDRTLAGDGLARSLAEAEVALRAGRPADAAAALAQGARAAGGAAGAALAGAAARLHEVAGEFSAAAAQRALAVAATPEPAPAATPASLPIAFGRLRDAARGADPAAVETALADLLPSLPPSTLSAAVARWTAALARGLGAPDRAADRLDAAPAVDGRPAWWAARGLLRDRIDRMRDRPLAKASDLLLRAAHFWPAPEARAEIDVLAAEIAAAAGGERAALEVLEQALARSPQAIPLALSIERIARTSADPALRTEAFRLWGRFDPARAAYAASMVVDTLIAAPPARPQMGPEVSAEAGAEAAAEAGGDTSGDLAVREALRDLQTVAPRSAAFWTLAAREARAGRPVQAAEALEAGADAWTASPVAAALRDRAAALRGREELLPATPATAAADGAAPAGPADARRRARALLDRAARPVAGIADRRAALQGLLAIDAGDPAGLALLALQGARDPAELAGAYWRAGAAGGGRDWKLWAVQALLRAGDGAGALERAIELCDADPDWADARRMARRLARTLDDPDRRARALLRLGPKGHDGGDAGEGDPRRDGELLEAAEAHERLGDGPAAEALFRRARRGVLRLEADRGLVRIVAARDGERMAADAIGEEQARVRRFIDAAREGRAAELAAMLENEPPHEARGSAASLYLAALIQDGRGDGEPEREAARLLGEAMKFEDDPDPARRPGLMTAWHAADGLDVAPGAQDAASAARARAAAVAAVAAKLVQPPGGAAAPAGAPTDPRSAAALLVEAAELDGSAGAAAAAEERLRAAVESDGACLPALRSLRRALIQRGALTEAAGVCEREAAALARPGEQIRALQLAAALAESGDRHGDAPPPTRRARLARAAGPLRKVLAIAAPDAPAHAEAFEKLRAIYTEIGEYAAHCEILAGRIAVAANPFEVTSLRLARADLLAGPVGDRVEAKAELAAVLQKEPHHGRALTRLADLHYDDGAHAQAAELYLQRALAERSPERLREIFLRLGRIYTRHVHDAKRAVDAYKRLLQLEADNREAIAALSDLFIKLGETKNAIVVTDRLVELEPDAEKRAAHLIRAGQLWEQLGDLRQAGARLRRAADDAPRSLQAVGELARHLERTRDAHGRRALLDHTALLLRGDLQAGKLDLPMLRLMIQVLQGRGRPVAAAAGAQLLAELSPDAADREAIAGWAAPPERGRRLSALGRPEIDERLWPAGLPSGIKNIFRLVGDSLSKGAPDLRRYDLARADAILRGQPPRDIIDPIAADLGVRDLDVYVRGARSGAAEPSGPALLAIEPGEPRTLILGARIARLGAPAIRFAAARALRLASAHLDLVMRGPPEEAGALIGAVVRQFVPDYRHPAVAPGIMSARADAVARLLPRRLRHDVMPFAVESAGGFDLDALRAAVRDGANNTALLASGSLAAGLAVVLAAAGRALTLADLTASPEALALIDFALSDGYDDLCHAME